MTHLELFRHLAPVLMPYLEREFHRRDLCIAATRIAIHIGQYFGVALRPQPCRVILANRQFAKHLEEAYARGVSWNEVDVKTFAMLDGSHSVGIGFPCAKNRDHPWPYHLVAAGGGWIADFSIQQGERISQGIRTGTALVATLAPTVACVEEETGTMVRYWMVNDDGYKRAPDWKHSRTSRLAGPLIRQIRATLEREREAINETIRENLV